MSTALTLGGGGPLGMAWELGLLTGVANAGVDLTAIDLTVGTSAGSAVGAWSRSGSITDGDAFERLQAVNAELVGLITKLGPDAQTPTASQPSVIDAMNAAAEAGTNPVTGNRAIGALALTAHTIPEAAYVSLFERLVGTQWPPAFLCEATDIDSGELQTWDEDSGISLGPAVAASCAWPGTFPVVTIAGRRYMDGGLHDGMNPTLASGHDTVICVSCHQLAGAYGLRGPAGRRLRNLRDGLDELRHQGANVVLVEPDGGFLAISEHGAAMMDVSRIPAAHAAGVAFGCEVSGRFVS
jgi:NTE family protein